MQDKMKRGSDARQKDLAFNAEVATLLDRFMAGMPRGLSNAEQREKATLRASRARYELNRLSAEQDDTQ